VNGCCRYIVGENRGGKEGGKGREGKKVHQGREGSSDIEPKIASSKCKYPSAHLLKSQWQNVAD